jgi:hypothetical protein
MLVVGIVVAFSYFRLINACLDVPHRCDLILGELICPAALKLLHGLISARDHI